MKTIQNIYVIPRIDHLGISIIYVFFLYIIDIFYPPWGEPISLQSLHCSQFEVVHYIFMGHCLAFAATSTREQSRILS
jgi:hypothetical protein